MKPPSSEHPICQKCKLFKTCLTPFMESHGAEEPRVLIVGEAPGATEDEQGVPFVGKSGRLLREVLDIYELSEHTRMTNSVRCRPPRNKTEKKHINYCKRFMLDEVEEYDPDLIILLGNSPLYAVLGESGITNWNGVVVERDGRVYVPLFHPAYVLRNDNAYDDWMEGWDKAVHAMKHGIKDTTKEYFYPRTIDELEEMVDYLFRYNTVAFDLETNSLDPFEEESCVIAVSLAAGDRAYAFPVRHPESWWERWELDEIRELMQVLLQTGQRLDDFSFDLRIVGHNLKFDQKHSRKEWGFEFEGGGDTMLISHLLDSRKGIHGLKRIAGLHLGMYDYDKELQDYIRQHPEANPKRGGNYGNIPLDVLLPYAAMDADATEQLFPLLYNQLTKKQKNLHDDLIMAVSDALSRMEYNGIKIDDFIAHRYMWIYQIVQDGVYEELMEDVDIVTFCQDFQRLHDDDLIADMLGKEAYEITSKIRGLFTIEDTRIVAGKKAAKMMDEYNPRKSKKRKRKVFEFNPNSPDQMRILYYDYIGIPTEGIPKTETNRLTTAAKELRPFRADYPILEAIRIYKLLGKVLGTYLQPAAVGSWKSDDGRARSNYNLHGTRTGRPSSTDPNFMNMPTPEKEPDTLLAVMPIKNVFTHTYPGGCVMSADFSGAELRAFASVAKCEPMLEIHRSGKDFHSMVAVMATTGKEIAVITDEDVARISKPVRYKYKWTNWTLLYVGDEYTLHRLYDIPLDEARETVEMYFTAFPEVPAFQKECVKFAEKHGYIESPMGRREYFFYINDRHPDNRGRRNKDRRACVNMPIQSGASDALLASLVVIDRKAFHYRYREKKCESMMVNTVYDSMMFDVYPGEEDYLRDLCIHTMENIVALSDTHFPRLDFSWLTSPMKADVEIGSHYGVVQHIDAYEEVPDEED